MSDAYIGEIRLLPYTFAPLNWVFCNGQLLKISENSALYSILGTTYGGDGRVTFGLPNLSGRIAMGAGSGPGLSTYPWGATVGSTTATMTADQLPQHSHEVICDTAPGTVNSPKSAFAGKDKASGLYKDNPTSFVNMSPVMMGETGHGKPHPNIQPFLVVNYCICVEGIYPPRS